MGRSSSLFEICHLHTGRPVRFVGGSTVPPSTFCRRKRGPGCTWHADSLADGYFWRVRYIPRLPSPARNPPAHAISTIAGWTVGVKEFIELLITQLAWIKVEMGTNRLYASDDVALLVVPQLHGRNVARPRLVEQDGIDNPRPLRQGLTHTLEQPGRGHGVAKSA